MRGGSGERQCERFVRRLYLLSRGAKTPHCRLMRIITIRRCYVDLHMVIVWWETSLSTWSSPVWLDAPQARAQCSVWIYLEDEFVNASAVDDCVEVGAENLQEVVGVSHRTAFEDLLDPSLQIQAVNCGIGEEGRRDACGGLQDALARSSKHRTGSAAGPGDVRCPPDDEIVQRERHV